MVRIRGLKFHDLKKRATKVAQAGVRAVKKTFKNEHAKRFFSDAFDTARDAIKNQDSDLPTLGKKIVSSGIEHGMNALAEKF